MEPCSLPSPVVQSVGSLITEEKVCAQSTGKPLSQACPGKSVV